MSTVAQFTYLDSNTVTQVTLTHKFITAYQKDLC
jgi:hypothetical protein